MEKKELFDKIYSGKLNEDEVKKLVTFLVDSPKPPFEVVESEKTKEQVLGINEVRESLKEFMAIIGHDYKDITIDRIHIAKREELEKTHPAMHPELNGFIQGGHIYLLETPDLYKMLITFSHEITHSESFLSALAKGGESLDMLRWGMSFTRQGDGKISFNGYNEAVTEMFSAYVRDYFKNENNLLSEKELKSFNGYHSYQPMCWIVQRAIKLIKDSEGLQMSEVLDLLFDDYLNGKYNFLKKLEKIKPGSARMLVNMPTVEKSNEYQEIARFFGLELTKKEQDNDSQN